MSLLSFYIVSEKDALDNRVIGLLTLSVGNRYKATIRTAERGSGSLLGYFTSKLNDAGGDVFTSVGNIKQAQISDIVTSELYKNNNVDILSRVHGFPDGSMKRHMDFFFDDVSKFGDLPGVNVHDINS